MPLYQVIYQVLLNFTQHNKTTTIYYTHNSFYNIHTYEQHKKNKFAVWNLTVCRRASVFVCAFLTVLCWRDNLTSFAVAAHRDPASFESAYVRAHIVRNQPSRDCARDLCENAQHILNSYGRADIKLILI